MHVIKKYKIVQATLIKMQVKGYVIFLLPNWQS